MGKARERRLRSRRIYLERLAVEDPERFQLEWAKRLETRVREVLRNAGVLIDENGKMSPGVYSNVAAVMAELRSNGDKALALAGEETQDIMIVECGKAVARVVDPRMNHLSTHRVRGSG